MGIARAGAVSATIGTSGVVFAATDRPALDPQGRLHTFCHAIPGRWHVMGVTQAAGLSLRWFRDRFGVVGETGRTRSLRRSRRRSSAAPAGSEGAFWLPYLMGERTPHLDPNARAASGGADRLAHAGHMIRAVMEGVALQPERHIHDFRGDEDSRDLDSAGRRRARGRRCGGRFRPTSTRTK